MNQTWYVYHICRENDKGNYSEGYIGITKRKPIERWKEHRKDKSWYTDYTDIIEYVIYEGKKQDVLSMEDELRPKQCMGWNITAGGSLPITHPSRKYARYNKTKRK